MKISPYKREKNKEVYFEAMKPYLQIGCSVYEACLQSNVPSRTVYDYQKADNVFAEMIKKEQEYASVLARGVVVKSIKKNDVNTARWYLSKKKPDEFGDKMMNVQGDVNINMLLAGYDSLEEDKPIN